ncbi:MAG: M3 family oligoendopeptidase [Gammaproteobacteria bacterium]|nr:M3 family oligoendopeptidase [Gammaproteobacteria bacterium]
MTDSEAVVQGVGWDLTGEYPAADSPEIDADSKRLGALLDDIERRNGALIPLLDGVAALTVDTAADAIDDARQIFALIERARKLLRDPETYAECCLSVDSRDEQAQALLGRLQSVGKRFDELAEPLGQFLDLAPGPVVEAYLADPSVAPSRFNVEHSRRRRHELLPLAEENLVTGLGEDGIHAWGRLYDQLSGTLSCDVAVGNEHRDVGLAEAAGFMQSSDDRLRENAWRAVNETWDGQVESCAAAINAIAGWRLELCRKRTARAGTPVHYLDSPLHANRIQRETLDTVLQIAEEGIPLARRAARLQAKAYGKEHYGPWDNRAPAPVSHGESAEPIPYNDALDLIAGAYGDVESEMGDFVCMMAEKRWIEGTVGPRKRPGAYCTGFLKSRTPRVYMTYTGGSSDVITLAHELGHGFHSWVMRDLPDSQRRYGMSIAETASTFGETIVRDALLRRAESPSAALDIVWEEAAALVTFILNIPTRFEFERNFYDARAERPLSPKELKAMMGAAWEKWYGESIAEGDPLFWASKLHFYISGLSFYNFPYLFGYLFSLGVYARRETLGDEFFPRYKALLMDTGRMTTEDLAAKHLEVDLREPDFWRDTLAMIEPRIDHFEALVNAGTQ